MASLFNANGTRWKFYLNSEETWLATKEACLNARRSIDIEQYIFEIDTVGSSLLDLLIKKKREGVDVRILCDMAGSYGLYTSPLLESLRQAGIEIRFFHPIRPWRIHTVLSWFFRDHRKLMIIDGEIGFVGGVGFSSNSRTWRDTHLKIVGPISKEMQQAFEEMWDTTNEKRILRRLRKVRRFVKGFQFITHSPFLRKRFFYHELITAIRNAKQSIYLTTPYFIPDRRLRRVLRLAARRGVDVKVLVPKVSNHPSADFASHAYYEKLQSSGVKMYHYKGVLLHAKTAVIDDDWATVGSFNLDSLSILFNYEANIVSTKPEFADEVKKYFLQDIELAEKVDMTEWKSRPFKEKVIEFITLPIRRFI